MGGYARFLVFSAHRGLIGKARNGSRLSVRPAPSGRQLFAQTRRLPAQVAARDWPQRNRSFERLEESAGGVAEK